MPTEGDRTWTSALHLAPVALPHAEGDHYRLNAFRWEGFWVTEEEFERACRGAVTDFSIARTCLGKW